MRLGEAVRRANGVARCRVCGEVIERGEQVRWSAHMDGYTHLLCIPAMVRALGEDAVRIYLRHGPGRLFPEGHRPGTVEPAEPARDPWPLRLLERVSR